MTVTPKIYVACLASYNAGILHGEWIDLNRTESIQDRINKILKQSPIQEAEEWAIHDHEYCGNLGEYDGLDTVEKIKNAFKQVESEGLEWELFQEFCNHTYYDIEVDTVERFMDSYSGSDKSLVDWCHVYLEDTGLLESIPDNLRFYFDVEAFARDMEINDVFTIEHGGDTHVFHNI